MNAKQLSSLLCELGENSDVTSDTQIEMNQRFESLRNYGLLPRGRENRGNILTNEEIINTILSLAATKPAWAGHVALFLKKLKPVGKIVNIFGNVMTLTEALSNVLIDKSLREAIVTVRLSTSEIGINSNGMATITYQYNSEYQQLSFVPILVTPSIQNEEQSFNSELRYASVNRELVFNQYFFLKLVKEIDKYRMCPLPLSEDSSEYDNEEIERARRLRLGVTECSNFLNIGVDNQVRWPPKETLIKFEQYRLVLMPKTSQNTQSIHIDLHAHKLSIEQAMTVINRFLSLLTWCDDQFAIAQSGWSGNRAPVAVPKRNLGFAIASDWIFNRNIPSTKEARCALALYREARNAEQNFMVSFAVLNYYKIIEIHHPGKIASKKWVADNLPTVIDNTHDKENIKKFLETCGNEKPEDYIYLACRVAVAHASRDRLSDPDEASELNRLYNAAAVMRYLARYFIMTELEITEFSCIPVVKSV